MPLQLERTLVSCSPEYQQADPGEIEIIVVDNGSDVPLSIEDLQLNNVSKVIRIDGKPSPVFGLNEGIKQAKFSNIAIMIDGAHMLSPGVFRNAKSIIQLMPRPVISIPQYIFGPTSQNLRTSKDAFGSESKHLKAIEWPSNGYRLFEYAIFPGENYLRDIYEAIESNCLITTKAILNDCGVLDERFDEPGGGLANLELYIRLCHDTRNEYVTTPGEGTFHQDHSGTTTSPTIAERQALVDKYFEQFRDLTGNENLLGCAHLFTMVSYDP